MKTSQGKSIAAAFEKRKRGRPAGNPTPLNAEQKRATNRAYERERREEQRLQQAGLARALGAADKESLQQILILALTRIRQAESEPSIAQMKKTNENLLAEIAAAEEALAAAPGCSDDAAKTPA